jgi:hypothetical protein
VIVALYSPAARSGKTTVAEYLMSRHGFERVRFAAPLKAMAAALFQQMGFTLRDIMDMVEGEAKDLPVPGYDFKPRDLMKTLGTEWGRQMVGMDMWTEVARRKIAQAGSRVVIDDLRFRNELLMLRGMDATMVRIDRSGVGAGDPRYEGQLNAYLFDHYLTNDGPLGRLYEAADRIVSQG